MWLQDIRKFEYASGVLKAVFLIMLMAYIFYGSFIVLPVFIPVWIIYMRSWITDMAKKKEKDFTSQFRDGIQSVSAALKAGYSTENSIREAQKDLKSLYGEDARIMKEFSRMSHQLDLNMTVENILHEFSERTGQEDVENFVNVFTAAKKSGGDSIAIIRNAVRIISDKIDTEREIQTVLASKKLEFNIMCAVPFFIILYMKITFGEFINVLYGNTAGAAVMTVCLSVYLTACIIGRKIIRIEV